MLHEFVSWIQLELGKSTPDGVSWSQALIESLTFWNLLEGTHLLSLMIFVGTIMLVDLRMLGLIFKSTPFTQISARVLPLTVMATGTLDPRQFGLTLLTAIVMGALAGHLAGRNRDRREV